MNDVPGPEPLAILKATGIKNLTQDIEKDRRYTLIYQGVSQVIDYVLELPYTGLGAARVDAMHINADFPVVFAAIEGTVYRSSDHDPLWVNVIPFTDFVRFPQVFSR